MSELALTDIDGIGPGRGETLADAGYESVEDIAFSSAEAIADDTDIPDGTVDGIIENATDLLESADSGAELSDGSDGSTEDAADRSDGGDAVEDDGGDGSDEFTPVEPDELDPFGFDASATVGVEEAADGEYLLEVDTEPNILMHVIHVVLEDATKKEQKAALEYRDYNYRIARKLMVLAVESGDTVDSTVSLTREEVRALYRDLNQGASDYASRSNAGDLWAGLEQFQDAVDEIRE